MSKKWSKFCNIPCRNLPQTDSPEETPRNIPVPSGFCPESGRLLESARSARFSELYGMSARSIKSLDILIENCSLEACSTSQASQTASESNPSIDRCSTSQTNQTESETSSSTEPCSITEISQSESDSITLTDELSIIDSENDFETGDTDSFALQLIDELIFDIFDAETEAMIITNELNDTVESDVDSFEGENDPIEIEIPKLKLGLLSARSNYSQRLRSHLSTAKSTAKSIGKGWDWKYLIPGYPWMGNYWNDKEHGPDYEDQISEFGDQISICSNWSNCS